MKRAAVSLVLIFSVVLSVFIPLMRAPPLEAQGTDFGIEVISSDKNFYYYGEKADLWTRVWNTGSTTIPTYDLQASFTVVSPSGVAHNAGPGGNSGSLAAGQFIIIKSNQGTGWIVPDGAEEGSYTARVTITSSSAGVTHSGEEPNLFSVGKPTSPSFVDTSFTAISTPDSKIQCSLGYMNSIGEDVIIMFGISIASSGQVVDWPTARAPNGATGTATATSKTLGADTYKVSWTAYRASDTSFSNPITWSASMISVTITASGSQNPTLQNVGISPPNYSVPTTPPVTVTPGGQFRAWYTVYNPNTFEITITLGLSIKLGSAIYSDSPNDISCTLRPQKQEICNRFFSVRSDTPAGTYDILFGIYSSPPDWNNPYGGIVTKTDWLNVVPQYTVTLTSRTTDGQSNVGSMRYEGVTYSLPISLKVTSGTHGVTAIPPSSAYVFHQWEVSGGVRTSGDFGSGSTNIEVTGDGTLRAVFSNPPSFDLELNPTALSVSLGGTTSTTVTVVSLNSFSGNVQITLGWPGDMIAPTWSCNPNPVYVSANGRNICTLSISVAGNTSPKGYGLTITGSSGSLTKSLNLPLTVQGTTPTLVVFPIEPTNGGTINSLPVTLKVQVTLGSPTSPIQGAQVTFIVNTVSYGPVTSDQSGFASIALSNLAPGTFAWSATASKEGYASGQSPGQSFVYQPVTTQARVEVTVSPNPVQIGSGQSGAVTYTLTERNGVGVTIASEPWVFVYPDASLGPTGTDTDQIRLNALSSSNWPRSPYLPPEAGQHAVANGWSTVILRYTFSGIDDNGNAVTVNSDLTIIVTESLVKITFMNTGATLLTPPYGFSALPRQPVALRVGLLNTGNVRLHLRVIFEIKQPGGTSVYDSHLTGEDKELWLDPGGVSPVQEVPWVVPDQPATPVYLFHVSVRDWENWNILYAAQGGWSWDSSPGPRIHVPYQTSSAILLYTEGKSQIADTWFLEEGFKFCIKKAVGEALEKVFQIGKLASFFLTFAIGWLMSLPDVGWPPSVDAYAMRDSEVAKQVSVKTGEPVFLKASVYTGDVVTADFSLHVVVEDMSTTRATPEVVSDFSIPLYGYKDQVYGDTFLGGTYDVFLDKPLIFDQEGVYYVTCSYADARSAVTIQVTGSASSTTTIWTTTPLVTATAITVSGARTEATVGQEGSELKLQVSSNSTVSNLFFDSNQRVIDFTVSGQEGTKGFCYVTMARELLDGQPIVLLNGNQVDASVSEDTWNYYVYFEYGHSSHHVTIGGSNTIAELPYAPIVFILVTAVATLLLSRHPRNRHGRSRESS